MTEQLTREQFIDFYSQRAAEAMEISVAEARSVILETFRPVRCPPDCGYAACQGWQMTSRWLVPADGEAAVAEANRAAVQRLVSPDRIPPIANST